MFVNTNALENLTDSLVQSLRFNDPTVDYPEVEKAKEDDGVIAEWFYPIYAESNEFSELSAIYMYTNQENQFEEIKELMLGIGMTEMKHYGKIGEIIKALGGRVHQRYNSKNVTIGKTPREALQTAFNGEVKTIQFYDELRDKINDVKNSSKSTPTIEIALKLIEKLRADEVVHQQLLQEAMTKFPEEEERIVENLS